MTSVYDEKLYPQIPSAPPDHLESQDYRLRKIDELEKFLRKEVESRDKLAKRFKRRATATTFSDTSVIVAILALGGTSIGLASTGIGIALIPILVPIGVVLGLGSGVLHTTRKIFDSKTKKHDKIKTLAESKLDSVSELVSKAIEDANISHEEYRFILKEVEHYRTIKEEIRTKSKKTTDAITAEQREAILAQGRQEGQQAFLAKIAASSGTPTASVT